MNDLTNEASAPSASTATRTIKKITTHASDGKVVFMFATGEQLTADTSDMPEAIREELLAYGLKQKIADSYSGNTGVADAVMKANTCITNLKQGVWKTKGGGASTLSEALALATGCTLEEAIDQVSKLTPEKRAVVKKHPDIKVALAEIALRKASQMHTDVKAKPLEELF